MKAQLIFALAASTLITTQQAKATSDAITDVHIVVQNIQDSEDFEVRAVPVVGCFGPSWGPALAALTAAYKVPSNIGCGGEKTHENINYLTCAKVLGSKEDENTYDGLSSIKLDISKCEQKDSPALLKMIDIAIKKNFAPASGKIEIKIVK